MDSRWYEKWLGGRKMFLIQTAMVMACVFLAVNKLDAEHWVDVVTAVVLSFVVGNGAEHFAKRGSVGHDINERDQREDFSGHSSSDDNGGG